MNPICLRKYWALAAIGTGASLLTITGLSPSLHAGQPDMMNDVQIENQENTWKWGISFDYMLRQIDRNEDYISPPELWNVDYDDYEGDLWGFSMFLAPPCFGDAVFDFSYRSGDMEGNFRNYSLDPRPIDPNTYVGRAIFDRDEFELGVSIPFSSVPWLFARVEGFYYTEDGYWDYGGGFIEPQEYDMWGLTAGLGAGHTMPIGGGGITLDLAAFLGLVYFDLEHTEVLSGARTSWNDWGLKGSVDARFNFPITQSAAIFTGVGYEYLWTDSGGLEQDTQGFLASLGIRGEW